MLEFTATVAVYYETDLVSLHVIGRVVRVEEGGAQDELVWLDRARIVVQRQLIVEPTLEEATERHLKDQVVDLELYRTELHLFYPWSNQKSLTATS